MMLRVAAWLRPLLGIGWLVLQGSLQLSGIYTYYVRAPWLQSLLCLVLALGVVSGLRRDPGRWVWLFAAPGFAWGLWTLLRMVSQGAWVKGTLTFWPALALLTVADLWLLWPRPARSRRAA